MPGINIQSPYARRVYAQIQSGGLLSVPNSSGSWNSSGANYIRVTEDSFRFTPNEPKVATNILHGSASSLARISGRKSGSWEMNCPIVPNGTQAVAPDIDPILQSVFGGPGALATGTAFGNAWQYTISNLTSVPLFLAGFLHATAATGNIYSIGSIPQSLSIDFNGNILGMSVRGVSVSVVPNEAFAAIADVEPKGGLTSFPSEPGSFSTNGAVMNAFRGTLKINNVVFAGQCDMFSVEFQTGQSLKDNYVDSAYPMAVIYGARSAVVNIGFVNNDSAALAQLKQYARLSTPIPIEFDLGTVAGQRVIVNVNGVQLVPETLTEQNGYIACQFSNSASSVTPGLSNDFSIAFA